MVIGGLFHPVAVWSEVIVVAVVFIGSAVHLDLHSAVVVCNTEHNSGW